MEYERLMARPFVPLVSNPHLLTILGNYWPRPRDERRFPVWDRWYETEPGIRVLVREQRPTGEPKGALVLVHGLESSSEAGYMVSMAHAALRRGYEVHRMNLRGCGASRGVCRALYHAGLTADVRHVVERIQGRAPLWAIGYSLGGNVVLKLAGELGGAAAGLVRGVIAVSAPIDLAACVRAMERPENRIYDWRFVRRMVRRVAGNGAAGLRGIRSVREFDDRVTAPQFGFQGAWEYYQTQSAVHLLESIRVPALIVSAEDDPLVPASIFRKASMEANPRLELRLIPHGGHLGFIARRRPRFWLDEFLLEWIEGQGNTPAQESVFTQE
jgi:predicted alpha/beta-fold hydrolase